MVYVLEKFPKYCIHDTEYLVTFNDTFILAPPRDGDVSLIYSRPDENHINLTCSARGVFPKPRVTLSWGRR